LLAGVDRELTRRLLVRIETKSPMLASFRQRVEHFFRHHGVAVWGPRFEADSAIAAFRRAAGIDGR